MGVRSHPGQLFENDLWWKFAPGKDGGAIRELGGLKRIRYRPSLNYNDVDEGLVDCRRNELQSVAKYCPLKRLYLGKRNPEGPTLSW